MSTILQKDRAIELTCPLGNDVLLFHRMKATEQMSGLFQYDLELFSEDLNIAPDDVLGKPMTVRFDLPDDEKRYFNGVVSRFSCTGSTGDLAVYEATLRPWLWFLTRCTDCRIFQEMKAPDIIKQVFRDHGFSDFDESLSGEYRVWEYCVQYRETDFNFVSRLMEQEGIYYFFKHEDGKHTLALADSYSAHETVSGYDTIPYFPPENRDRRERDHITEWCHNYEVQPGKYVLNEFDFKKPKANLLKTTSDPRGHEKAEYEVYDYPGEYVEPGDGDAYSRIRYEEVDARHRHVQGGGNAAGIAVGSLFTLDNFPRDDQNCEHLVIAATHNLKTNAYTSGAGDNEEIYSCGFTAIDSQTPYRAPRNTPKPIVQGPQTAIVVGPAGEEIYTDKYGRVKVQFHWDREGKSDEKSSCWVRVSQPWAGKSWGGMAIPRMGQEVIVEFLEGDPDRPIITGRVYNADNMPPYGLPANATRTTIKSRSSKGGGAANFNEIRFEDLKGSEEVFVQAEKDMNTEIKNDETRHVGNDRTKSIDNNETVTIGVDRTEDVGNNEIISIGNNRTEKVGSNEMITIGMTRTTMVQMNEMLNVGVARERTVGTNEKIGIGINREKSVGNNEDISIGSNRSAEVGKNESLSVGEDRSATVGKNDTIEVGEDRSVNVGKKLVVEAGDEIMIKTGKASILMKKNGDITIQGKKITIKGSGDVIVKGSKILEN